MIDDYVVVVDSLLDNFEGRVNGYIKAGWQLHGGLVMISDNGKAKFAQAMVKYPDPKPVQIPTR